MGGLREHIRFMRVGTLDNPVLMPPDVHIFTTVKQAWVRFPEGAKVCEKFYQYKDVWSEPALVRRKELFKKAGIEKP